MPPTNTLADTVESIGTQPGNSMLLASVKRTTPQSNASEPKATTSGAIGTNNRSMTTKANVAIAILKKGLNLSMSSCLPSSFPKAPGLNTLSGSSTEIQTPSTPKVTAAIAVRPLIRPVMSEISASQSEAPNKALGSASSILVVLLRSPDSLHCSRSGLFYKLLYSFSYRFPSPS